MLAARGTEIALGGLQVVPIGSNFSAACVGSNQFRTNTVGSCLIQESLDYSFRFLVCAFAVVVMSNPAHRVNEVQSWPVMVRERVSNRVFVIDRDRIGHAHVLHRLLNVVDVVLEAELGGVHPDYDQTLILVFFRPRTNIRKRS